MQINQVIQGDCLELTKELQDSSIDLIITDPPYGIDYQSSWRTDRNRMDKIVNDKEPFIDFIPEAYRVLKDGSAMLCFTRYDVEDVFKKAIQEAGFILKGQMIWDKVIHGMGDLDGDVAPQHENIIFATKGRFTFPNKRPHSVLRFQRVSPERLVHPNEKPVGLLGSLIDSFSGGGATVLDMFTGSGSTIVAAKEHKRNFIGFEIDPKYVAITNKRLLQETLF